MPKYKVITPSGSGSEKLGNALAGLGERRRRIIGLRAAPTPAAMVFVDDWNDVAVVAYKNQDQVCEFSLGSFLNGNTSYAEFPAGNDLIDLDLMLEPGDGFQVGFKDLAGGTAQSWYINMVYEDK